MQGKVQPKKKRIAPQKEAELPVVASVPETIAAASFRDDDATRNAPPPPRRATGGIEIDIRKTPMVNIHHALKEHGLEWHTEASPAAEGSAANRRTQADVVKRILERQTRLFEVRDVLSESDSETSESGMEGGGGSEGPSEMDASEDEEEERGKDVHMADPTTVDGDAMEKCEEEEALDEEQEEEWGLKNIGDYDVDDAFIDDSEIHHYFDNIRKKTKYSGFYIHKGPLRMIEQPVEQKSTMTKGTVRKSKAEGKAKNEETRPNGEGQSQTKRKSAQKKSKASQQRSLPRAERKDAQQQQQNGRPSSSSATPARETSAPSQSVPAKD